MTITPGVNMITRYITLFFHLLFELYLLLYFNFAFQDVQNSVPWDSLFALCSGLQNTHLPAKDDTFKPVNIYILFLHKLC